MGDLAESLPAMPAPGDLGRAYGVSVLPTTVVVDAEGRILSANPGPVTADDLHRMAGSE